MKFLVDESLSPRLAKLLTEAGHDAMHLRDRNMQGAEDPAVIALARNEGRVLISADADFATILTLGSEISPSVIFFRGEFNSRAESQAQSVLSSLPSLTDDLDRGAIVVVRGSQIRVRRLRRPE